MGYEVPPTWVLMPRNEAEQLAAIEWLERDLAEQHSRVWLLILLAVLAVSAGLGLMVLRGALL